MLGPWDLLCGSLGQVLVTGVPVGSAQLMKGLNPVMETAAWP